MSDSSHNSSALAGTKRGPAEYFLGPAWVTMLAGENPTDCTMGDVTFEPGVRNNWHSHPAGQLLVVTAGATTRKRGSRPGYCALATR